MNQNEVQDLYTNLNTLSLNHDWTGLERMAFQFAEQNAGPEMANIIQFVNLEEYISRLNHFLETECLRLSHHAVKALYFEYDLKQRWNSKLFICDRYSHIIQENEEWTNHWIESAAGPDLPEFARLYKEYGGPHGENLSEIGVSFFLIARTTAAFGKAIAGIPTRKMAVCVAHRGQEKITRIFEQP